MCRRRSGRTGALLRTGSPGEARERYLGSDEPDEPDEDPDEPDEPVEDEPEVELDDEESDDEDADPDSDFAGEPPESAPFFEAARVEPDRLSVL
jgi:hypothetical protein